MRTVTCLAIATICSPVVLEAGPIPNSSPSPVVRCVDGRVTVHAHGAHLGEVVADVARQADVVVIGDLDRDREVQASFDDEPLNQALRRLLDAVSFTEEYDRHDRLTTVRILSSGTPSAPTTPRRSADVGGNVLPQAAAPSSGEGPSSPSIGALNASKEMKRLGRRLVRCQDSHELAETMTELFRDRAPGVVAELARDARSPQLRALASAAGSLMGEPPEEAAVPEGLGPTAGHFDSVTGTAAESNSEDSESPAAELPPDAIDPPQAADVPDLLRGSHGAVEIPGGAPLADDAEHMRKR